jgi:hypothetical protein
MGDELPEERPAGGGLDRVLATVATVTEAAGGSERKQRFAVARKRRQLGKEPLLAFRGPVDWRIHRPRGRQTMIAAETA